MEDLALVATVAVAKKDALFKSGPKKNKLKKGCRFKGKKVYCTPDVAARIKSSAKPKSSGRKSPRSPIVPKSPQAARNMNAFQALLMDRKNFKMARDSGNCGAMRQFATRIKAGLQYMGRLPAKTTKKNPSGSAASRNRRYISEMDRVAHDVMTKCSMSAGSGAPRASRDAVDAFAARRQAQLDIQRLLASETAASQRARRNDESDFNRFNGLSGKGKKRSRR